MKFNPDDMYAFQFKNVWGEWCNLEMPFFIPNEEGLDKVIKSGATALKAKHTRNVKFRLARCSVVEKLDII